MSNVLVSIIIPTRNRVDKTTRALKSCFLQTYSNIEVILVDDGSDFEQRPAKWLDAMQFEQSCELKIVQLDKSHGGGWARNAGVQASKGDFVTFLDSDDVYLATTIEKQVTRHLISTENIITYGKATRAMYKNYTFHSELGVYPSKGLSENLSIGEYLFCHEGRMFTPTLFMHRDVFDNIKFDSRLKRHQDYGFVLRAESLGYKFVFIDEILFHWISDENYEGSKEKNITIDISIDFLAYYGHLMQPVAVKDYLNKIAAPIALKNFSLLRYYKILKAYRIKKHNRFFLFSIVGSLFKTIKAKLGLIF